MEQELNCTNMITVEDYLNDFYLQKLEMGKTHGKIDKTKWVKSNVAKKEKLHCEAVIVRWFKLGKIKNKTVHSSGHL